MSLQSSRPWRPSSSVKPETWGAFLEYASLHGVKIEKLDPVESSDHTFAGCDYLSREVQGQTEFFPMPQGWTNDRILRYRVVLAICNRFEIPMPHWTLTL